MLERYVSILSGVAVGAKRMRGRPVESTTNLVKFHLMSLLNRPPSLDFRNLKKFLLVKVVFIAMILSELSLILLLSILD